MTRVLAVDAGLSRCKLGVVNGASLSQLTVVEDSLARFFSGNGCSALCAHLASFARVETIHKPEGLALAIPFGVDHRRGSVASNWLGGWPDRLRQIEDSFSDESGLPCIVLNDAVAFALGCPAPDTDYGPQASLCLTLGTYFGCALRRSSSVQPVEVNRQLGELTWPNGHVGYPSSLANLNRQRLLDYQNGEYSRSVGWIIGSLQRHLGRLPVVLGGGYARLVVQEELVHGIAEVGGLNVAVNREPGEEVALLGAAHLWSEVVERRRPIGEVVAPSA